LTPRKSILAATRAFPAALPALEPLAFAGELKDRTMVHEPIDHRCRCHRIRKDVAPVGERKVGADRNVLAFVSPRDDLKEQVGRLAFERNVAKFVDQQ
jgi:hypothetical protein